MVIEKVHGLKGTSITLNERFTMLAAAGPARAPARQKRRPQQMSEFADQTNYRNHNWIEEITRQLEFHAKKRALHQRLGVGQGRMRRAGSESNILGLRRSNSFGDLSQAQSIKSRLTWRQSNGNFSDRSRSVSMSRGAGRGALRGFRRRGGGQRALRGRFRGGRQAGGRVTRATPQPQARNGSGRGPARRARGNNRGGPARPQTPKPPKSREELDAELEQYMAGTKAALDKELDNYMRDAMDLE